MITPAVRSTRAPTPSAMIDSPSARMMTRLWRSAKCPGTSFHPRMPNSAGPPQSIRIAIPHSASWAPPERNDTPTSSPIPIAELIANPTTDRRSPGSSRLAMHEERDLPGAHHPVRDREQERAVPERLRNAQRGDEERGCCQEHRDSNRALFGLDDARQPRVAHPGPPEHGERQHPAPDSLPRRLGRHERGALSEREHEHEVEEELERFDDLALTQLGVDPAGTRAGRAAGRHASSSPPPARPCFQ